MRLLLWADQQGGWKVCGSSRGFRLPDGSVFSPDASVIRLDRWQALSPDERRGFAPLCPDLVVELASPNDEGLRGLSDLRSRWHLIRPMALAWAGCCCPTPRPWRWGPPAVNRNGSTPLTCSMLVPSFLGCSCSSLRSGRGAPMRW